MRNFRKKQIIVILLAVIVLISALLLSKPCNSEPLVYTNADLNTQSIPGAFTNTDLERYKTHTDDKVYTYPWMNTENDTVIPEYEIPHVCTDCDPYNTNTMRFDREKDLQVRFCALQFDQRGSHISCGHKLRQDGQPITGCYLSPNYNCR